MFLQFKDMGPKKPVVADISTEEKIKAAARQVFLQKGFAATRTRDIAEASGINLALLNYYFRSKQKLFSLIMLEKMQDFFGILAPIFKDKDTSLEKKVELIAEKYIDMVSENPELPLFILSELRNSPDHLVSFSRQANFITQSAFLEQLQKRSPSIHPFQFLISLLGLCLFPFLMRPVLETLLKWNNDTFNAMMQQRKQLIPEWIKAMLATELSSPLNGQSSSKKTKRL